MPRSLSDVQFPEKTYGQSCFPCLFPEFFLRNHPDPGTYLEVSIRVYILVHFQLQIEYLCRRNARKRIPRTLRNPSAIGPPRVVGTWHSLGRCGDTSINPIHIQFEPRPLIVMNDNHSEWSNCIHRIHLQCYAGPL